MPELTQALSSEPTAEALEKTFNKVNDLSKILDDLVNSIVDGVCAELDCYVQGINEILQNQAVPVSDIQLDDFTLNLPALLYFVSSEQETLGIKDDISKAIQKEVFNRVREKAQGTVADKDTAAELSSQNETIANVIYNRAYKKVKLRIEAAYELLASVKKVMTRRIAEMELSKIDSNTGNRI